MYGLSGSAILDIKISKTAEIFILARAHHVNQKRTKCTITALLRFLLYANFPKVVAVNLDSDSV